MKRKLLALFLVLALVACLVPASALAAPSLRVVATTALPRESAEDAEDAEQPQEDAAEAEENAEANGDAAPADGANIGDEPMPPAQDPGPEAVAAAAALAEQIQPDGEVGASLPREPEEAVVVVGPDGEVMTGPDALSDAVTVAEGETLYAYEGMTVFNNGGTVYSNLATVYNNGGLVFVNGGTVFNNAGAVYANGGTIYNNAGHVYRNQAEVFSFTEDEPVSSSLIFDYFELKFADYYEPYILVDGAVAEPGSERMLLGEDSVCRISPYPGLNLKDAETTAGELVWDELDGSVTLSQVDGDVTLTLTLQPDAPAFQVEDDEQSGGKTVSISGPAGSEIYYTLDGSVPDAETGTRYEAAFPVAESGAVKAVAVIGGLEASEVAELSLAFLSFSTPTFDAVTEGYYRPFGQTIVVENPGEEDVEIVSVTIEGEDAEAFSLSTGGGKVIPAGGHNDSKWNVRPVGGLSAGTYEASVVFTLSDGGTAEVPVRFTVLGDGSEDADPAEEEEAAEAEEPEETEEPAEAEEPEEGASAEAAVGDPFGV